MCAVERIKQLPFEWIINPEDPPRERRTLTQIANAYIDNHFRTMELNPAVSLMLITMVEEEQGSKSFKRMLNGTSFSQRRQEPKSSVEKKIRHKAKEVVEAWVKVHVLAIARLKEYVQLDNEQECSAAREQPIEFGLVIMNNHPWMKIAVVGACEPYTRSQRILTEVNSILMMLLCCLWFFYSR
eukprot:gene26570-32621_t